MPNKIILTKRELREESDLREISDALDSAQELAGKVDYLSTSKMPCPECGGSGSLDAGSLGSICPGCMGARFLDHPSTHMDGPHPGVARLGAMRKDFKKYCRVLDGYHADRSLPPPPTDLREAVPSMSDILMVVVELTKSAAALPSTPVPPMELPRRKQRELESGADDKSDSEDDDDWWDGIDHSW